MLGSGVIWGFVIGTFCGAIANLSPATYEFRRNMSDLNTYISANDIDRGLGMRLRDYFHRAKHLHDSGNSARILSMMSPALQTETIIAVNRPWHRHVWFLNHDHVAKQFVVRLQMVLSPLVLSPYELCPHGFLYILYRGVVVYRGAILTKPACWGEDIVLKPFAPNLVRSDNARAMNFAEVFMLDWTTLNEAMKGFPQTRAHIRRTSVRLAMRREFVRVARLVKRREQLAQQNRLSGADSALDDMRDSCFTDMLHASTAVSAGEVALQHQLLAMKRQEGGRNTIAPSLLEVELEALPSAMQDAHVASSSQSSNAARIDEALRLAARIDEALRLGSDSSLRPAPMQASSVPGAAATGALQRHSLRELQPPRAPPTQSRSNLAAASPFLSSTAGWHDTPSSDDRFAAMDSKLEHLRSAMTHLRNDLKTELARQHAAVLAALAGKRSAAHHEAQTARAQHDGSFWPSLKA